MNYKITKDMVLDLINNSKLEDIATKSDEYNVKSDTYNTKTCYMFNGFNIIDHMMVIETEKLKRIFLPPGSLPKEKLKELKDNFFKEMDEKKAKDEFDAFQELLRGQSNE